MGKILNDSSFIIPRNPNVTKIERDEVLTSGVQYIPATKKFPSYIFAYRMKVTKITEPGYQYGIPSVQGYLNCYNDGLLFFPDVEPGFAQEFAHLITHVALGSAGESIFSYLGGPLSKIAGEITSGRITDRIFEKTGSRRKMFEKALSSKDFFFIPYAELTGFMKRTEHSFLADYYKYVLSHETADGKKNHYLLSEKSGGSTLQGGSLDEVVLARARLEKEIEDLALTIIKAGFSPLAESFIKKYGNEYQAADSERQKEITMEYSNQLELTILAAGYTLSILDVTNFKYIEDRKLATEILEKLSPTIQSFKQAPHQSMLIEILEAVSQGKSKASVYE